MVATPAQCKLFMAVADSNQDNFMDTTEYVSWLGRITGNTFTAASYEALPASLQTLYTTHAIAANGQIDINGARPGTATTAPAQGANLDALCTGAETTLAAVATGGATTSAAPIRATQSATAAAVATVSPGAIIPATAAPGIATAAPASSMAPTTNLETCKTQLAAADTDGDGQLNVLEYVAFVNSRPGSLNWAPAALPQPVKNAFLSLSVANLIDIYGATPSATPPPTEAQLATLQSICATVDQSIAASAPTNPPSGSETCNTQLAAADSDGNGQLNPLEYTAFVNSRPGSANWAPAALPQPVHNAFFSLSAANLIDIYGAAPSTTPPPTEAQLATLQSICTTVDQAIAASTPTMASTPGPGTIPPAASTPGPGTTGPVATAGPGTMGSSNLTPGTAAPGTTAPLPGTAAPLPGTTSPPGTATQAPAVNIPLCTASLAAADADRDDLLTPTEYIAFLNRLYANQYAAVTEFAALPQPLQDNYNKLLAESGFTAEFGLPITGANPSVPADAAQTAILTQICEETHAAVYGGATPGTKEPGGTSAPGTTGPGTIPPGTAGPETMGPGTPGPGTIGPGSPDTAGPLGPGPTGGPSITTPGSMAPTMDFETCKNELAAADADGNGQLNTLEYVALVNSVSGQAWAPAALPQPVKDTFSSLAAADLIDIYGAGPSTMQPTEAQIATLQAICTAVDQAINLSLSSNNPSAPGTAGPVTTMAPVTPGGTTPPPTDPFTVTIHSSFIISSNSTAAELQIAMQLEPQPIEDAYEEFVEAVVPVFLVSGTTGAPVGTAGPSSMTSATMPPLAGATQPGITGSSTNSPDATMAVTTLPPGATATPASGVPNGSMAPDGTIAASSVAPGTSSQLPSAGATTLSPGTPAAGSTQLPSAGATTLAPGTPATASTQLPTTGTTALGPGTAVAASTQLPTGAATALGTAASATQLPTAPQSAVGATTGVPGTLATGTVAPTAPQSAAGTAVVAARSAHNILDHKQQQHILGGTTIAARTPTMEPGRRMLRGHWRQLQTAAPGTVAASTGVPGTTSTAAPGGTAVPAGTSSPAGTAAPGTALPGTASPGTVDPSSAATPGSTGPTTAGPGSSTGGPGTIPSTATPGTAGPTSGLPETETPGGSAAPGTTTPSTLTPGTQGPGIPSGSLPPETADPSAPAAGTGGPSTVTPGTTGPSTMSPGTSAAPTPTNIPLPVVPPSNGTQQAEGSTTYDSGSAKIVSFEDAPCPSGVTGPNCIVVFAEYSVTISDGVDRQMVYDDLVAKTQESIRTGALQSQLVIVDPSGALVVLGPSEPVTPGGTSAPTTAAPATPAPTSDDLTDEEKTYLGLALAGFLGIVLVLVCMTCIACGCFGYVLYSLKQGNDSKPDVPTKEISASNDLDEEQGNMSGLTSTKRPEADPGPRDSFGGFKMESNEEDAFFLKNDDDASSSDSSEEEKPSDPGKPEQAANDDSRGFEIGGPELPDEFKVDIEEEYSSEEESDEGDMGGFVNKAVAGKSESDEFSESESEKNDDDFGGGFGSTDKKDNEDNDFFTNDSGFFGGGSNDEDEWGQTKPAESKPPDKGGFGFESDGSSEFSDGEDDGGKAEVQNDGNDDESFEESDFGSEKEEEQDAKVAESGDFDDFSDSEEEAESEMPESEVDSDDESQDEEREVVRQKIVDLVRDAAPHELDNIDMMMEQFEGREEELLETLKVMHAKKSDDDEDEGDSFESDSGDEDDEGESRQESEYTEDEEGQSQYSEDEEGQSQYTEDEEGQSQHSSFYDDEEVDEEGAGSYDDEGSFDDEEEGSYSDDDHSEDPDDRRGQQGKGKKKGQDEDDSYFSDEFSDSGSEYS